MDRPPWPRYFMNLADVVKTRSNCLLNQVGAVLVKDRQIIATGYNGTPTGVPNCLEGGCERCMKKKHHKIRSGEEKGFCLCVHAEVNAIIQCAYHGMATKDVCLYSTLSPCMLCAKEIINAGINSIYYAKMDTGEQLSIALLKRYIPTVQLLK